MGEDIRRQGQLLLVVLWSSNIVIVNSTAVHDVQYDLICPDLEGLIGGPLRPLSVRLPSMFQEIHRKYPDKLEASALRRW